MAKPTPSGLHIVVERADLLRALTATTKAVESRNTYPILANVLLTAEPESLQVRGTDLDVEITTQCAAKCVPGITTVPAKTLLEIVRKFPDGAGVTITLEGDKLIVKAGRSRFQLPVIGPDAFPTIKSGSFWPAFEVDLAALFAPVSFAISNEETRYYLNGIFVHDTGSAIRAVATDGHRLARHDGQPIPPGSIVAGVIVPKKTVALVPKGIVKVELSDNKMRITAGDTVLLSKLIEGTFPDYERVTPKNSDKLLTVDRASLASALDRVGIVATERGGKAVKLVAGDGRLEMSCRDGDGNTATEDVSFDGEMDFEIGYNAGYLSEIVRVAGGGEVTFKWTDANSPSIITGANDNWLSVLMPMRAS